MLILSIIGPFLLMAALVWCALILCRLNRKWFFLYVGLMAGTLLSGVAAMRQTYMQVVLIPIGALAFSQVALLAFHPSRKGRGPFWLMSLAFVLTGLAFGPDRQSPEYSWIGEAVFLTQYVGIFPLIASSLLLMAAGWKVGRWWGLGLNPVSAMAVLPVFVLQRPAEGRKPAFRFLIWSALVFVLAFVDSAVRSDDPLLPVGLTLSSVGAGAFIGAVIWALAASFRTAAASWRVSKEPLKPRFVSILRDGLVATKTPVALSVVSAIIWFGGVVAYGDLIIDRHPMARSRSRFDVLCGCGWSAQLGAVLRAKSVIPKEQRLANFRFNPAEIAVRQTSGAPAHDPGAAVALAKASLLVYADRDTIRATARQWGFADDRIRLIGFGSTETGAPGASPEKPGLDQALILADARHILIAFRGTDQFMDWGTNLNPLPTDWLKPEWRHHGFDGALGRIRQDLLNALMKMRDADQSVWLTGHSLGGALAALAAIPVSDAIGTRIQGLYTFAQPKIAGENLAQKLGERIEAYYRFVLYRDVVPESGIPGSLHAGAIRYIDSLGVIRDNDHWTIKVKDAACASIGIVEAHGIANYLTSLELAESSSQAVTPN